MTPYERLKLLLEVHQNTKPQRFDWGLWACTKSHCGTFACVLGNAGLDPRFQEEGLHTQAAFEFGIGGVLFDNDLSRGDTAATAAEFFGLTCDEASALISGDENEAYYDADLLTQGEFENWSVDRSQYEVQHRQAELLLKRLVERYAP